MKRIILALLTFPSFCAMSQIQFGSLQEMLAYADKNAISIQTALRQEQIATAKNKASKTALMPAANVSAGLMTTLPYSRPWFLLNYSILLRRRMPSMNILLDGDIFIPPDYKPIGMLLKTLQFFALNLKLFTYTPLNGEKFPLFKNLEYIESVCDPNQFFRINRQVLINRDAISSIESYVNRKVIVQTKLNLSEKLIVSRLKVTSFKDWLEG